MRLKSTLADYTGGLETRLPLRITDKNSMGPPDNGLAAGTTQDAVFSFAVRCAATSNTTTGSTCAIATTANALVPGATAPNFHAVWQLGQVRLFDGGADSDGSTPGDNTLFAVQGVFVP